MASNIRTIIRTAAIIFAEDQELGSGKSGKRRFIDAAFFYGENRPMKVVDVIQVIKEQFAIDYLEDDISKLLSDERYYTPIVAERSINNSYYLPQKRFEKLQKRTNLSLEKSIAEYLGEKDEDEKKRLQELIYKFLYTLLNTNIDAFAQLLERKGHQVSSVLDKGNFEDEEIETINNFLSWDNEVKDKALFQLINYCIEYACEINSIDPREVVSSLRNKKLYLDNTLIYRLLGINGRYRKERAEALIQRCVDSGQQIIISSITRKEFFETINFHISNIINSTPFGHINPELFHRYTGGYTIYQYYHDWRRTKTSYGQTAFKLHIQNEYNNLLLRYHITEDFKQLFDENDTKDSGKIDTYVSEISQHKGQKNEKLLVNDAKNVLWLELARAGCDNTIRDTKCYFLTSDRKLQCWDLEHSKNQPITMLPSQWLALLLKFFSKSDNDYSSFVSFLSMPKEKAEITQEELQDMLSGISELTEDFKKQDDIISSLMSADNSIELRNREAAKKFTKEQLETSHEQELKTAVESEAARWRQTMDENDLRTQAQINAIKDDYTNTIEGLKSELIKEKISRLSGSIDSITKEIAKDESNINKAKRKASNNRKILVASIWIIYIVYIFIVCCIIKKFGWDCMEPITYILSLVMAAIPFLISLSFKEGFNVKKLIDRYQGYRFNKLCKNLGVNEEVLADKKDKLDNLKEELASIDKDQM